MDLLPVVPGDGGRGVSVERVDLGARPADRGPSVPKTAKLYARAADAVTVDGRAPRLKNLEIGLIRWMVGTVRTTKSVSRGYGRRLRHSGGRVPLRPSWAQPAGWLALRG